MTNFIESCVSFEVKYSIDIGDWYYNKISFTGSREEVSCIIELIIEKKTQIKEIKGIYKDKDSDIRIEYIDLDDCENIEHIDVEEKKYLFYFRSWSESKYGGASMIHQEKYLILNEIPLKLNKRESQEENNDNCGFYCWKYDLIKSYFWAFSDEEIWRELNNG